MIDWQLLVNGEFPSGWDQHKDGCWFPDFDMQRYLLPYFDVGNQPIDEYGATTFDQDAIKRLKTHLLWQRGYLEAKDVSWRITETFGDQSHSYEIKRDAALQVIDKTLTMIDRAIGSGGDLVFRGD
jgi:hypothetical protein